MNYDLRHSRALGYIVATASVLGALALRWALSPWLGEQAPLLSFVLATMVAAWRGGLGPGLAAMVAGEIVGDYFFVPPYHTIGPTDAVGWMALMLYFLVAGSAIAIVQALHRARARAAGALLLAQARGEQLQNGLSEMRQAKARIRELTEREAAAATAVERESDQRFRLLADAAPVMIWTADPDRLRTWFNRRWLTFTGRSLEEESGTGWTDGLHAADRQRVAKTYAQAFEKREPFEAEYRLRRADGEYRWVLSQGAPLFAENGGSFLGYVGSCLDVTERKQAEEALEEKFNDLRLAQEALSRQNEKLTASRKAVELERGRYRELFNSAPVGYIITSRQGVIEQANAAATQLLGEGTDFLIGFPFARLLAREERAKLFANIGRLTRREISQIENWEVKVEPHGKGPFPCAMTVNLLLDEENRLTGLRWLLRDITERKQTEERLLRFNADLEQRVRERTAELEAANRELEAFSYSVSHDLRAPLRSVSGFSKAVLEEYQDRLDPQGVAYLRYACEASQRMSRLIEDLIALSRFTRCELRRQDVDLSSLAEGILGELKLAEPQRNVQIDVTPQLKTRGDEGLLRIALQNLLNNAWKFTAKQTQPKIEFGATQLNGNKLYFVRDNGAGFSMNHADRLFGVFQRLHSTEDFPGTGIGLATVKRIFQRHGGEIWAEGSVNKGATFYFSLPNGS